MSTQHIDEKSLSPARRRALVSGLIVALPALILVGAWRLGGVSALEDDLIYYLPVRQYIGQCIRAGHWPLWNPLTQMGTSIAADPQSGLWYPPTWLFALLPALAAYPLTIVLHFALAGGGMYRLLRSLRRDWRAALLGAIAFEFCGYLIAHRAHLTIHHAVAWLPWIFLGWQRFAQTGRYRHFALAVFALGMQMLVQHVQVTLMTCSLLTAYVAFLLWPTRRSLLWQYPLGMVMGILIGAVQLVPTYTHFATSGRGAASYSVFVENSWVPSSALMLLFPMLFGCRTPNLWAEPWWGLSHLCEQYAYGSILILILAGASLALLEKGSGVFFSRREIAFWWIASLVALVVALGEFTPVSKWLFHLPIYRSLRAPARWILVWSVAMPILASAVMSVMLSGGESVRRVGQSIRITVLRVLPAAVIACLATMVIARLRVDTFESTYGYWYRASEVFGGLRHAIRPANPAIWWPILLMIVTAVLLIRWTRTDRRRLLPWLFVVMIIDLASVAAFIDVDVHTYDRADLHEAPALGEAIRECDPDPGHRLLVPRLQADYKRPIEMLWPQTNLQHDIPTFNGYGPLWPVANRMMFRFMPWGSSEAMLDLLRRPDLMRAMGIRFLATRTEQERRLMEAAMWPADKTATPTPIPDTDQITPVRYGADILWPVHIDQPGLYELAFEAAPSHGSPSRWYIRLEKTDGTAIGDTQSLAPEDLPAGKRRTRFIFRCDQPVGPANARIKSQMGHALSISRGTFGRVAVKPTDESARANSPFIHRADLPGGITLYELPQAAPLVRWTPFLTRMSNLNGTIEKLQDSSPETNRTDEILVQMTEDGALDSSSRWMLQEIAPPPELGRRADHVKLDFSRPAPHELSVHIDAAIGGIVVFNESYNPGWRAWVDGRPTAILRVNAVCQGVTVPPGPVKIRFVYRPPGLTLGAILSIVTLVLLAAGFLKKPAKNVCARRAIKSPDRGEGV